VRNLDPEKAEGLSLELQRALEPLLAAMEAVSQQICEYNERIEALAQQSYPQVALLKQIKGVGTLIGLTFLLTLEDPHRFRKSRDVGCYLGLQPGRRQFGSERSAAAHQQRGRSLSADAAGAGSTTHLGALWHRL
jgi:transposase